MCCSRGTDGDDWHVVSCLSVTAYNDPQRADTVPTQGQRKVGHPRWLPWDPAVCTYPGLCGPRVACSLPANGWNVRRRCERGMSTTRCAFLHEISGQDSWRRLAVRNTTHERRRGRRTLAMVAVRKKDASRQKMNHSLSSKKGNRRSRRAQHGHDATRSTRFGVGQTTRQTRAPRTHK